MGWDEMRFHCIFFLSFFLLFKLKCFILFAFDFIFIYDIHIYIYIYSTTAIVPSSATRRAATQLLQFMTAQEISLTNHHRRDFLNLELRLLHHHCCSNFVNHGIRLVMNRTRAGGGNIGGAGGGAGGGGNMNGQNGSKNNVASSSSSSSWDYYQPPILPLDKDYLRRGGYVKMLSGALKPAVMRQPLSNAIDSLSRTRLMFGSDPEATARVMLAIYTQMCTFYGDAFLFPVIECCCELLDATAPSSPPSLPLREDAPAHNLGVDANFWSCIEKVHTAAKSFDRELWAEHRTGSARVWEILTDTESYTSMTLAKQMRFRIFREIEERGEFAMMRALEAMSAHIQWMLIGGEQSAALMHNHQFSSQGGGVGAGNRLVQNLTNQVKDRTSSGQVSLVVDSRADARDDHDIDSRCIVLLISFILEIFIFSHMQHFFISRFLLLSIHRSIHLSLQ
jgi:hypothetical protein